jgi:LuxR family quorum-sensing system transcriptional regulator CciR
LLLAASISARADGALGSKTMQTPASSADNGRAQAERQVTLSRRQTECLYWVQEGKSAVDIGLILGLSPRTVEEYLAKACDKLEVRTRVQAVVRAHRLGLLGDAP